LIEEKPWGSEELLSCINDQITPKIIDIKAGHRYSLHYHKKKDEQIYCISGSGLLQNDSKILKLLPRVIHTIHKNVAHRVQALSDLKILEINMGEYDKDDIYRMEDDYGRI